MKFYLRRFGFYLAAFFFSITLNFAIPRLMPGNPVDALLNRIATKGTVTPGLRDSLAAMLGTPKENIVIQYFQYIGHIFTANLGTSASFYPATVSSLISTALPWTVCLVGLTTIISFFIQQAMGIKAGWKHGKAFDNVVSPTATIFQSVPYFWLALILIAFLAVAIPIFPTSGGYDFRSVEVIGFNWTFISSAFYYGCLPALTILISSLGLGVVGMRNMMVSTLSEDYIVTAEAKGLSPNRIKYGYAARNAILPSISGFGIALGQVVGGSLLVEQVFNYPGIGNMLFTAVQNNDYSLLQGIFLIITTTTLVVNFIVDLLYGFIDPRTRVEQ